MTSLRRRRRFASHTGARIRIMLLAAAPLIPSLTPAAAADAVACPPEAAEARAVTRIDGPAALAMGMVDELAESNAVIDRAVAVAAELGAKKPRLFAAYKKRFRGETADCMLAEDMRYIDEEMDVAMFQNCDLSCLRSLS